MMTEDGFFWFRRNRIVIPGVRGEHRFMHITDTHVHVADALSTAEEREKVEAQIALWKKYKPKFALGNGEPFGAPQEISTQAAFEKLLALAEEMQPEALLLSGDNLDYMHPAGERYLARQMAAYRGRYLCVPGNHEDPACSGVWSAGVRTLDFDGFRIAAVDNSQRTVSAADLDALRALCGEGVPLIVLCHVPIATPLCRDKCTEPVIGQPEYFYLDSETDDEGGRAFASLCVENDAIRAILCGHVHGYHAMEFAPGKPQIVGSSGMNGAVDVVTVCGE